MIENIEGLGVILVDHGSKFPAANAMLTDVARVFQDTTGVAIVEVAHMELAEPTLEQAYIRCVARGARRVAIQPYFLAPGRHSTSDIPQMSEAAAAACPGIPFHIAEPLGVDVRIAEIMAGRIAEALARTESPAS